VFLDFFSTNQDLRISSCGCCICLLDAQGFASGHLCTSAGSCRRGHTIALIRSFLELLWMESFDLYCSLVTPDCYFGAVLEELLFELLRMAWDQRYPTRCLLVDDKAMVI
jgi:hypothetical protein